MEDFKKFFDNIDLVILMSEAIQTKVPLDELVLGLQQHTAPRVLQCSGFSGNPVAVFKSILPGCKKAVTFTKIFLKRAITGIVENHKHESNIYIYTRRRHHSSSHWLLRQSCRWGDKYHPQFCKSSQKA